MLSGSDIKNFFAPIGFCPNIVKYSDLLSIDNLPCFILYEQLPNVGHWTLLFRRNDGMIEFFDPYGITVDDELSWTFYDEETKQKKPLVNMLLKTDENNFEINKIPYQGPNSITCGLWCCIRLLYELMGETFKFPPNSDNVIEIVYDLAKSQLEAAQLM